MSENELTNAGITPLSAGQQIAILLAVTKGFIDDVSVEKMDLAEKSILEMGEELLALFREQGQADITNGFPDIVSGFKTLREDTPGL